MMLRLATRRLSTYSRRSLRQPSLQDLRAISDRLGFASTQNELEAYQELIDGMSRAYETLNVMEDSPAAGTRPQVPRTCGRRPGADENPGNAWYWRCDVFDREAAERKGAKLAGRTLALKDTICLAGVPMMNGSRLMEGFVPTEDATVVKMVLAEGGRIIGKAACEDLCLSGASHTNYKAAVPNPHSELHTSGGSSSGCGYLVAKGLVDMAIGGDQGGSIRIPSAWCGIVGVKPTYGLVPYTGAVSIMYSLDHLGPMARSVSDAALLLEVLSGVGECKDPRQPRDLLPYRRRLLGDLDGLKVGVLSEGFHGVDADVDNAVESLATRLSGSGASVTRVSLPLHRVSHDCFLPYLLHGFHASYIFDGVSGCGHEPAEMAEAAFRGRRVAAADNQPIVKVAMLMSEYLADNYGHAPVAKASNWLAELGNQYDRALADCHVLLMPTLPFRPPRLPREGATVQEIFRHGLGMLANTAAFNATGHPAVTVNCSVTEEKLPVGAMLVGARFDEDRLMDAAYGIEQMLA